MNAGGVVVLMAVELIELFSCLLLQGCCWAGNLAVLRPMFLGCAPRDLAI
jgi:hypothetical protein